ncbi:creatininase family protein [Nocardia altamirensis]|uniref:creatininase family protein n=1 Tax=Nocardia altamirensis TaxID=472158 RepID=UPI0008402EF0|nr:creatininase family protein [Nocardia altamirensis]
MRELVWNRMTAAELRAQAARDAVVLLPVGSTEQHGPHLPTGVDDFLADEVCRRAAEYACTRRDVVVAPSVRFGLAEHHMAFGGTFTLTLATMHALLRDLCRSILRAGFSKILIVNGHGGNIAALGALVTELATELSAQIAVTTYFVAGRATIAEILDTQDTLMHACEAETSMIMATMPELVRMPALAEAVGPAIELPTEGLVTVPISLAAITSPGVAGDARAATAAKGKALLDGCAHAIANLLVDVPWWAPADHSVSRARKAPR